MALEMIMQECKTFKVIYVSSKMLRLPRGQYSAGAGSRFAQIKGDDIFESKPTVLLLNPFLKRDTTAEARLRTGAHRRAPKAPKFWRALNE